MTSAPVIAMIAQKRQQKPGILGVIYTCVQETSFFATNTVIILVVVVVIGAAKTICEHWSPPKLDA